MFGPRLTSKVDCFLLAGLALFAGLQQPSRAQDHADSQNENVAERYALLVGVDRYASYNNLAELRFAVRDVEELEKRLLAAEDYKPQNVRVLTYERGKKDPRYLPTASNIRRELSYIVARKSDSLLIGLAGHGVMLKVPKKINGKQEDVQQSFFCPIDADLITNNTDTLLCLEDLWTQLGESKAKLNIVLCDACRKDNTVNVKGGLPKLQLMTRPKSPTVAILMSCDKNQVAYETPNLGGGHGVFFHYVIDGFSGNADSDNDGVVTLSELTNHVQSKVDKFVWDEFAAKQEPEFLGNSKPHALLKKWEVVANSIGMKLVRIRPGSFTMGCAESEVGANGEHPQHEEQHRVQISKPFFLGVFEVTQQEFTTLIGNNPSWFRKNGHGEERLLKVKDTQLQNLDTARLPAELVSWYDAVHFCATLSKKEGRVYRLPTEAEWEYACRAGTDTVFNFADSSNATQSNCKGSRPIGASKDDPNLERTAKVGSYQPNGFGLHDMHGNVWEWCSDWYDPDYYKELLKESPKGAKDPSGPTKGEEHVIRGGAWFNEPTECRSAHRSYSGPATQSKGIGFRVLMEIDPASDSTTRPTP